MTLTLAFLTLLMAGFAGWLVRQSVSVTPWVADSVHAAPIQVPVAFTAPRVALVVFLAVVTSVFALTISAYMMRMAASAEWQFLPQPALLWVNSAVLVAASIALQAAWVAAKRQRQQAFGRALGLGAACTIAFLAGQYLLWLQLGDAGYYMSAYVGSAFFVLMSALHGLHLLGGLVALTKVVTRLKQGATLAQTRELVGLCAVYWHYLLFVWAVLFVVLFLGAAPLYAMCRGGAAS